MLSEREYARRMFWGRIAYHIYMAIPTWLPFSWFTWLLPASGFYAFDTPGGYRDYAERCSDKADDE